MGKPTSGYPFYTIKQGPGPDPFLDLMILIVILVTLILFLQERGTSPDQCVEACHQGDVR